MKKQLTNGFYFIAGIGFLILAKLKNKLAGYTPKQFTTNEIQKCIDYDLHIVDDWIKQMGHYDPQHNVHNKNVLELGPGSDLGTGVYLLAKGAANYTAVDVYDLAYRVDNTFYDNLLTYLKEKYQANTDTLTNELTKMKNSTPGRLNYICNSNFDFANALHNQKFNLVVSNAAFEHFDNVRNTIKNVSSVVDQGALFIVSVDLQTHSRWIRDKDPNNIYRYPDKLYKLLSTRSSPNRVRPFEYKTALEEFGWTNVVIKPDKILEQDKSNFCQDHLHKQFQDPVNQMNYLTIRISATKS